MRKFKEKFKMENANNGYGEILKRCLLRLLSSQNLHDFNNLKDLLMHDYKDENRFGLESKTEQTAMNIVSKVRFHLSEIIIIT